MGLTTTVSSPIVHLCPHVPELDCGTAWLTFEGDAPELHGLRQDLEAWAQRAVTHEALTQAVANRWSCAVRTQWRTAGMLVVCQADPE